MDDKELVDRVVALGVVSKMAGKYWLPYGSNMEIGELPQTVARDWRVAGALMEKCEELRFYNDGGNTPPTFVVETPEPCSNIFHEARGESLPHAIIEACVSALTTGDSEL